MTYQVLWYWQWVQGFTYFVLWFSLYYIHTNIFTFKAVFNVADELLKTANQNPRLALHKAKAGWILLGALMTLGK